MTAKKEDFSTSRFMEVYNNLPMEERDQPVVVIDGEPVSWKMARREIAGRTDLGKRIFKKLKKLKII
ncbi:MAG: hypothetical protein MUP58_03510 [Candidatus Nanohaloarchaeota archaeon QJJ-9]|nr:hypothetical protein [Candidatus Nanohaloarchaeota archaeon QJJ-9]